MSRAFVKEADGQDAFDALPDRLVSPHPNLVTKEGLAQIESELARHTEAFGEAQRSGDRAALNVAARDLRYWTARRASAEVVAPPPEVTEVHFGSEVTIAREDGRRQTWRIVGEDEADPTKGTLSYVSPLARALMGKSVGDEVKAAASEAEIISID